MCSRLHIELSLAQADACEHLLGVEREVGTKHPAEEAGVAVEHVGDSPTTVFALVEDLLSAWLPFFVEDGMTLCVFHLFPYDAASKVDIVVHGRELSQSVHVVG